MATTSAPIIACVSMSTVGKICGAFAFLHDVPGLRGTATSTTSSSASLDRGPVVALMVAAEVWQMILLLWWCRSWQLPATCLCRRQHRLAPAFVARGVRSDPTVERDVTNCLPQRSQDGRRWSSQVLREHICRLSKNLNSLELETFSVDISAHGPSQAGLEVMGPDHSSFTHRPTQKVRRNFTPGCQCCNYPFSIAVFFMLRRS